MTRFVLVQSNVLERESLLTKAAWKFTLEHKRGSLAAVLNVISDCNLNLTKIQSLPIIETPGKYAFFVDLIILFTSSSKQISELNTGEITDIINLHFFPVV